MLCENQQSNNMHTFDNNISSSKADLFALYIIPKFAFVEKADGDNSDFELVAYGYKRAANRLSARDNQTQESVIGPNIAGPPSKQRLLGAKSSKKPYLDE